MENGLSYFFVVGGGFVVFIDDAELIGTFLPNGFIWCEKNAIEDTVICFKAIRTLPYFPYGVWGRRR